ncbi:hypothetical protein AVEN_153553-2-1, partial [Araneus ventricosus]
SLKCSRLQVHRNLSIALLVNLILLIVSSSPILTDSSYKHTEWLCKSVLTLQMYSSLASINWMFVEGLLLHSRVTVHIFKKDAPFKLYYCIGWGFPAICIGLWCLLMTYHHNTHCWAGYGGQQYIWLITGPMIAALLILIVLPSGRQNSLGPAVAHPKNLVDDGGVTNLFEANKFTIVMVY